MDKFDIPKIKRSIEDFVTEEDGSILRNKVIAIGSIMVIMGLLMLPDDAYAAHSSHKSHSSHARHMMIYLLVN